MRDSTEPLVMAADQAVTSMPIFLRPTPIPASLGFALLAATLLGMPGCSPKDAPPAAPEPVAVTAVTVQAKTVPFNVPYIAQVQSSHQVEVMARVSGFLKKISYKEGERVRRGQVLFELDKKPYEAEAAAARADVEVKRSELFMSKAQLERIMPLAEQDASSKKDLDDAIGNHKKSEAALLQAQARYDKAMLDVGYATITAPVDGVASQALIREGGYVAAGSASAKLATVSKLDPVWVEFSVSQNQQDTLHQEVVDGRLLLPKGGRFTVELELANGQRYPHTGQLNYVDAAYSKDTGSFLVRAEIPNPKPELAPGMYVKAYLQGAQRPAVLTVPQRAVRQGSDGHEVFVVNDKDQAELRPVLATDWVGSDWIIRQGLKPGDRVVVEGGLKLAPGLPVKIVTDATPGAAQPDATRPN